jgi:hypothetical protein
MLVVDAHRMTASEFARECVQPIARRYLQILEPSHRIDFDWRYSAPMTRTRSTRIARSAGATAAANPITTTVTITTRVDPTDQCRIVMRG